MEGLIHARHFLGMVLVPSASRGSYSIHPHLLSTSFLSKPAVKEVFAISHLHLSMNCNPCKNFLCTRQDSLRFKGIKRQLKLTQAEQKVIGIQ